MTKKIITLVLMAAFMVSAQNFSVEGKGHSTIIKHGDLSIRLHKKYSMFDVGKLCSFELSLQIPKAKVKSLETVTNNEKEICVRWKSEPGKNKENAKVEGEYDITVHKDFPGIFVESRLYNKDFIGELNCAQRWAFPGFTEKSYPADRGELKIGTAWRKMKPVKYFIYKKGDQTLGIIIDGLEKPNRSMFTNFSVNDFPAKKVGLWLAVNSGRIQENECSRIKFVLVPAKNIEELKKQYELLLSRKDLKNLWKY